MGRLPRKDCLSELNHVYLRRVEKSKVFHDDRDCYTFLLIMEEVFAKYGMKVHVYCLMPNHYHFLLQGDVSKISDGMRDLNSKYARYYNDRYERVGHLFECRFHSKPVFTQDYYETLFCYITFNPLDASLVADLKDWAWSSYRSLVGKEEPRAFQEIAGIYQKLGDIDIQEYLDFRSDKYMTDLAEIEAIYKYDALQGLKEYILDNAELFMKKKGVLICFLRDEKQLSIREIVQFLNLDISEQGVYKIYYRAKQRFGEALVENSRYQRLLNQFTYL